MRAVYPIDDVRQSNINKGVFEDESPKRRSPTFTVTSDEEDEARSRSQSGFTVDELTIRDGISQDGPHDERTLRGRRIEDLYSIGRRIGHGAFSTVHECTSLDTSEVFAVKIVDTRDLSPTDLQSLGREISIMLSIDHPSVITLVDVFETEDTSYLVFELAGAGDLFERINSRGSFPEATAAKLMKCLIETVAHLHEVGIIHRDLKPENILMVKESDDTVCKLSDFGFAIQESHSSTIDECSGTPQFIAPEIIQGRLYGPKVDVWSLGVVLYAVLSGYLPFYHQTREILFRSIIRADYHFHSRFWGHVSAECRDMVCCMLKADPEERWSASQLLQHPWILRHNPPASCQAPPAMAPLRQMPARPHRRGVARLAARLSLAATHIRDALRGGPHGRSSRQGSDATEDDKGGYGSSSCPSTGRSKSMTPRGVALMSRNGCATGSAHGTHTNGTEARSSDSL